MKETIKNLKGLAVELLSTAILLGVLLAISFIIMG